MPEGNSAGFGDSAVTSGIIERETKQTWKEAGGGTKDMLPLPQGCCAFQPFAFICPRPDWLVLGPPAP